ncbi:TraY domain-containing protein [Salmonella enterica]|uniref:TraY domain-containing protein n=1 Tax=Salmonella enterica TaxID=28901 RepID=UPI0009AD703F|nr:TraY domain-containing protein [Salmonella enterica]EBS1478522.1 TraY domain-containing protein [Salmonella enterica subsp. enterica serovar Saintpaul]ECF7044496.1 TraY domain-containing protein [Salmonella enterica subsp. enterica]ECG4881202.1 TraY domain-containing protein [Salmonella enterica subsp. enterica serovar Schwarzengrund]ECW3006455.1 TraY domain-containing protein [Salmonella enterica subsp. enterica serovar Chester]EDP9434520.1 TraY domain-containing protein [Salmonella enteri
MDINKAIKPIKSIKPIPVELNEITDRRLKDAAKRSGRLVRHEAMIRLAHSLKHIPVIDEVYWEILQEDKQK